MSDAEVAVVRRLFVALLAVVQWAPTGASAFDLQGHRGARGLAPENTLAAFRRALAIGVTTLETDVVITRDLVPVISHNPRLEPHLVRDGSGKWLEAVEPSIHSLSLEELRRYDVGRINPASGYAAQFPEQKAADGEPIPTLAEVVQLMKRNARPVRLNLETKLTPDNAGDTPDPATFVRIVVDVLRRYDVLSQVTLQSFDWRTLIEARRIAPGIETSCLTIQADGMDTMATGDSGRSPWHAGLRDADYDSVVKLIAAAGCRIWSMFWRNLTPALIAEAHASGLKVLPWTVNEPDDMRRLIEMNVDGIITDYPDRLRRVMAERGLSLP